MKNLINKEINAQSLKKVKSSKFFKACFVGCLATCLTLTGIFAFAPLGASTQASSNNHNSSLSNNLNNSTKTTDESTGLITPRADDPVLFTTENGLEIKYGNSTAVGGGNETGGLETGNLAGFPYFETADANKSYTWVIIGKSTNFDSSLGYIDYSPLLERQKFLLSPTFLSFFENTFETTTPAGTALNSNNLLDDLTALYHNVSTSIWDNIVSNAEIKNANGDSENCVLVLANEAISTAAWGTNYTVGADANSRYYHGSCFGNSSIKTTMNNYYTNSSLGLQAIKAYIQTLTITTYEHYLYREKSSSGNYWVELEFTTRSNDVLIFPLAYNTNCSFCWSTYLTADQMKLDSNQWLRGTNSSSTTKVSTYYYSYGGYICNSSGTNATLSVNSSAGYRPAFVMSLV